ncbi:hypothetical protein Tco_1457171 [Tanacetum coccineum]
MSSPNHPTSDIEDAFSSNFLDYIPASPDYVPASPGKTYSSSSNNSFGVVPIVSPTLLLFHDDPLYEGHALAYYAKDITYITTQHCASIYNAISNVKSYVFFLGGILSPKKQGHNQSFSSTSALPQEFEMITDLEQIIEEIQVRHQPDNESLLNAIFELRNNQERPSDY